MRSFFPRVLTYIKLVCNPSIHIDAFKNKHIFYNKLEIYAVELLKE